MEKAKIEVILSMIVLMGALFIGGILVPFYEPNFGVDEFLEFSIFLGLPLSLCLTFLISRLRFRIK
ncbi:hypothetical protein QQ008_00480 [Fulvivirgaceae bacterium BMA10]|uniref:DUF3955 domain-containing protein n=1 Tax=Splendidivirga corallicola TaxID=3051826 RepID=A0ABT8KGH5_9BACT|nr:hypothetical protein [Fulvivirgaceae bacterium BMA10]